MITELFAKEGFKVLVEVDGRAGGAGADGAFFDAEWGLLEDFVGDQVLGLTLPQASG